MSQCEKKKKQDLIDAADAHKLLLRLLSFPCLHLDLCLPQLLSFLKHMRVGSGPRYYWVMERDGIWRLYRRVEGGFQ